MRFSRDRATTSATIAPAIPVRACPPLSYGPSDDARASECRIEPHNAGVGRSNRPPATTGERCKVLIRQRVSGLAPFVFPSGRETCATMYATMTVRIRCVA